MKCINTKLLPSKGMITEEEEEEEKNNDIINIPETHHVAQVSNDWPKVILQQNNTGQMLTVIECAEDGNCQYETLGYIKGLHQCTVTVSLMCS